jgi:hypothetical protein
MGSGFVWIFNMKIEPITLKTGVTVSWKEVIEININLLKKLSHITTAYWKDEIARSSGMEPAFVETDDLNGDEFPYQEVFETLSTKAEEFINKRLVEPIIEYEKK